MSTRMDALVAAGVTATYLREISHPEPTTAARRGGTSKERVHRGSRARRWSLSSHGATLEARGAPAGSPLINRQDGLGLR